jgi:hypothetical protein
MKTLSFGPLSRTSPDPPVTPEALPVMIARKLAAVTLSPV